MNRVRRYDMYRVEMPDQDHSEFFLRISVAIVCAVGAIGILFFGDENTSEAFALPFGICEQCCDDSEKSQNDFPCGLHESHSTRFEPFCQPRGKKEEAGVAPL